MRTSFPSAHSPFIRFSKQRRKGGLQVPRALCPTHLSRSKCSSPVPPNAPISRQRSCECAVMLRMLRHRIDQPSSPSFPVHSLYISDTQGRTRWEESSPSLCPTDHSAGILHSRLRLTAARDVVVDTLVLVGRWLHLLSPSTTCCCRRHMEYVT
ncbi:hypothetical protein Csa_021542 [Cucumis sativus]|nr:hypothetical protein Csa_021537 [Cucumis sativus]KAE8647131.1 hypothetical protein Csa_021542 [Cucumis sativus]